MTPGQQHWHSIWQDDMADGITRQQLIDKLNEDLSREYLALEPDGRRW